MDKAYVIYKNNKIYRTGSKNAVYLNKDKAIEVVLNHCKDDASKKWSKKVKSNYNLTSFKNLSKEEQQGLIRKEFDNYSIRIFTDVHDEVEFWNGYSKGVEPEENNYDGWNVFKMGQSTECPSCHSMEILGTPNEINGKIKSKNICCNCGRVFEEEYELK